MRQSTRFLFLAVIILILATGLRFYQVGTTGVTTDEALTYQRTQGNLSDRLEHIAGPGNHVPLFFLAEGLMPTETDLGLRYLGLMLSLIGIALMMRFMRWLYHSENWALMLGLWLAVTPFMVAYARDARPYPMVFVFGLLASGAFFRLLRGYRQSADWLVFGMASLLVYFTHYAAAALPISQFLLLLWIREKPQFIAKWIGIQAVASLPNLIWLLSMATPQGSPNDWITVPNIGRPYYTLTNIAIGYEAIPTWYFVLGLIPFTIGLGRGSWHIFKQGRQNPINAYWLILTYVPILLVWTVSQFRPLYVERYFMVTSPAFFFVTLVGWQQLQIKARQWLMAAMVICVAGGVTLNELATTHFEPQDWRDSTAYMLSEFQDGDGILLDGPHETAFWHYYRGQDQSVVLSGDAMDALVMSETSVCELPYERLWLLTGNTLNPRLDVILPSQKFAEKHDYYRISVRRLNLAEICR